MKISTLNPTTFLGAVVIIAWAIWFFAMTIAAVSQPGEFGALWFAAGFLVLAVARFLIRHRPLLALLPGLALLPASLYLLGAESLVAPMIGGVTLLAIAYDAVRVVFRLFSRRTATV
jgi:hypothetical protein